MLLDTLTNISIMNGVFWKKNIQVEYRKAIFLLPEPIKKKITNNGKDKVGYCEWYSK